MINKTIILSAVLLLGMLSGCQSISFKEAIPITNSEVIQKNYLKPHSSLTEVTIKRELNDGENPQAVYFDNNIVVLIKSGEIVNLYFPFGKHEIGTQNNKITVELIKEQHKIYVLKGKKINPSAF